MRLLRTSTVIAVALCQIPFAATAIAEDWVLVGKTSSYRFEMQRGSFKVTVNKANERIYAAGGRMIETRSSQIEFQQWYIRKTDCDRGSGKKVTADIQGNFLYDNDYVRDGGTISSDIGDVLCTLGKDAEEKSI